MGMQRPAAHPAAHPCPTIPCPQDAFAARSHRLAAAAQAAGKFRDEIVPVATVLKDPKTGEWRCWCAQHHSLRARP